MDIAAVIGTVVGALLVGGISGVVATVITMRIHIAVDNQRHDDAGKWRTTVDQRLNRHANKLEAMYGHAERLNKLERKVFNGSSR